jgi:outer membrane protein OmpA-like peptidoglycan-associated protein
MPRYRQKSTEHVRTAGARLTSMCLSSVFRLGLVACIGILLASEPYRLSPAPRLRPAPRWVRQRIVNVPDVYFCSNSHVLSSRERQKVAQIAPVLQDLLHDIPDLVIVIEGYSDDWFRAEYKERLAIERADAVRQFLLELSFPEACFRVASFGFRDPHCTAHNERCFQQYRRGA